MLDGLRPPTASRSSSTTTASTRWCPPLPVADGREALRRAIRQIDSGGNTNLHGGWLDGAETRLRTRAVGRVSRVILLSDGCANEACVDRQRIWAAVRGSWPSGRQHQHLWPRHDFNEELMVGMARAGGGNPTTARPPKT